ncbi:MAG: glycoside hydrolase family 95 protein, partial [Bacteroidota bacterium]
MKHHNKLILLLAICTPFHSFSQDNLKLWYKKPASKWTEALPVGNGRLGAMVFGRVNKELIQLNEATFWTGGPVRTNVNPGAYANLQLAREALFKNQDYAAAYNYAKGMQGYYSESYLPLGDLTINQDLKDTVATAYFRDLNIKDAISTTRFTVGGVEYTRQVISSAPDQVIVIHLTASKKGALSFKIGATSQLRFKTNAVSTKEIMLTGRAPAHIEPNYVNKPNPITWDDSTGCRGMRFAIMLKAKSTDGAIAADTTGIDVANATDVIIYLSAATSFNGFDKCPLSDGKNEKLIAGNYLEKASAKSWQTLLAAHQADYHHYFNRVSFIIAIYSNKRMAKRSFCFVCCPKNNRRSFLNFHNRRIFL